MIEDWSSYSLSDFLLFSPQVYFRLLELHNKDVWPAQLAAIACGAVVFALMIRPDRNRMRLAFGLLGVVWVWVAWSFFWERYATINWAASYAAPAIALEGLMLLAYAAAGGDRGWRSGSRASWAALALIAFALAGYPFIAPVMDRPWQAAEIFAIAPDPTAVATLATLALANGFARWLLMIIPVLWCAITGLTLWTLGAGDFFVAPAAAIAAVAIAASAHRP